MTEMRVGEIAAALGAELVGDADKVVRGVADLASAGPEQLGFVRTMKYRDLALRTRAGALLVPEPLPLPIPQILSKNVGADFARIAAMFFPPLVAREHRIHPSAAVDPSATLEPPVEVGPFAVVGPRTRIGAGTLLGPRVTVGADCRIGAACRVHAGVVLSDRVQLGARVEVHGNAVLGADGFGYALDGARYVKVPQLGGLQVGDDVDIGAGCTIDRGAIGDTRIGRGTKIDNLVHIGHNCVIGEDVAIAAFCALSGSVQVGDRVQFAGHVVVAGHLKICAEARIGGNSVVLGDVAEAGDFMGYPLMPKSQWFRTLRWLERASERRRGPDGS